MAETIARRGGIAIIPQDIPVDIVADVTRWVKARHLVFDTAITLGRTDTVGAGHLPVLVGVPLLGVGARRTGGAPHKGPPPRSLPGF